MRSGRDGCRVVGAWFAPLLLIACNHSSGGPGGVMIGGFCGNDRDCSSGLCLMEGSLAYCTARCSRDADCDGLACGVRADGSKACLNPCVAGFADPGFTCKDGVPISCAQVGPEACADCGCPTGSYCQAGIGCLPQAQVGEACTADGDCQSANCSWFAGVCRVRVGQPCLADNCDICLYDPTGWSFCSRECDSIAVCSAPAACLGVKTAALTCWPWCSGATDPSCPGTCRRVPNGDSFYCDCPNCQLAEPKHDLGEVCRYGSDCKDGACQASDPGSCLVESTSACGTCTKACTSDADCGSGMTCVTVCDSPQGTSCGNICLRRCATNQPCAVGSCRMLPAASGSGVLACDGRHEVGGTCTTGRDCLTSRCVLYACAPADGVPNGAACGVSSDCKSNSCVSGYCKGNAQIGEACTAIIDCATGTCCSNVCKTAC